MKPALRILNVSQMRDVLDRDGWCCNKCGYVPFHTADTVPYYASNNYIDFCAYIRGLRSPIIFVQWDILPERVPSRVSADVKFLHGGELQFDHIIPIHKGGSLDLSNVRALCKKCHDKKSYIDYKCSMPHLYTLSKYCGAI